MENEKVEEQGMSFSDILFLLKKNILLIIIVTAVFTILGGIYALKIKKPTYTGTVTAIVLADGSGNNEGGNNPSDFVYASYYTDVFKSLIESNPVMSATRDKLEQEEGIKLTREEVKNCINVSTQNNSLIITVSAKVHSKDDTLGRKNAQVIANTVINSAISEANKPVLDENNDPVFEDGKLKYVYGVYANKLVVMEAVEDPSDVSYSRGAGTTIVISLLIGLILSFGIILVKYLVDDTFTSKDVFEKKYDIQVLSVIEEIKAPEEQKANEGGNK